MLGTTQRDRITGFQGIVTGTCYYLTGCNQALLQPRVDANGIKQEAHWLDFQRLEQVGSEVVTLDNGASPGCDMPAPIR